MEREHDHTLLDHATRAVRLTVADATILLYAARLCRLRQSSPTSASSSMRSAGQSLPRASGDGRHWVSCPATRRVQGCAIPGQEGQLVADDATASRLHAQATIVRGRCEVVSGTLGANLISCIVIRIQNDGAMLARALIGRQGGV